jgi:hypothetical protein
MLSRHIHQQFADAALIYLKSMVARFRARACRGLTRTYEADNFRSIQSVLAELNLAETNERCDWPAA